MGDESNRRRRCRRREAQEPKAGFAVVAYPADAKIGIKQVAYLHSYCGLQPHLIAAKYPKILTLSDVHLALAHYFRDPTAIDAELKREIAFNARDGLGSLAMNMPRRDAGDTRLCHEVLERQQLMQPTSSSLSSADPKIRLRS